ncbi:MAG: GDSL-type esterase/lipase family protein [Anaerovoracaceae bacterium]|nr:GDSL-type esterase/lipase family protein [Anaerovoracaceae bacterium]
MLRILCFGDSNTYGYDPRLGSTGRYPESQRWTGRLNALQDVYVRNLGMNGAMIPRNANYVEEICLSESPDLITIMFGSNDVLEKVAYAEQIRLRLSPGEVAERVAFDMGRFLGEVQDRLAGEASPEILLIAPPSMAQGTWTDERIVDEVKRLAPLYRELASELGVNFMDASSWPLELCFDGVHLTEEGHRVFFENIKPALTAKM